MELNGKCKEEFEKWFYNNTNKVLDLINTNDFYLYPESMQYGVYVDFFDIQNVSIGLEFFYKEKQQWYKSHPYCSGFKTRQEARQSAIQRANEIFNNR